MDVKCLVFVGPSDSNKRADVHGIYAGVQIVIGTPCRLLDLIKRYDILCTKNITMFVLDDADELFVRGFKNEIYEIHNMLPPKVKVLLSSTRISSDLFEFGNAVGNPSILIDKSKNLSNVEQFYMNVLNEDMKVATLCNLYKTLSVAPAIIFCSTLCKVDKLVAAFKSRQFVVASLQENLNPSERKDVLSYFKDGSIRVLVTTDKFLRSINVLAVHLVFNVDLPSNLENYMHRLFLYCKLIF